MSKQTEIAHIEQLLVSPGWKILEREWNEAKKLLESQILDGVLAEEEEKLARIKRLDLQFVLDTPKLLIQNYKEVPSEEFTGDPYATEADVIAEREEIVE